MNEGYYRFPTIHDDNVVFVCEDDLWSLPVGGGMARRLTSNLGMASHPFLSPDGQWLAFTGQEEGHAEVYLMPAQGGAARRLTYLGVEGCQTVGWSPEGKVLLASSHGQPFRPAFRLFAVGVDGGPLDLIPVGRANTISYGPKGGVLIGRNVGRPAYWKRYRGGTVGQFWIDLQGVGDFRPFLTLEGNLSSPIWLEDRLYFLSDHEGIGNLYSCRPSGEELRRHTDHDDYYARNASSDGRRIVYHAGAELYCFDPVEDQSQKISIQFHSPRAQRNRKFVPAEKYLDSWRLHPQGHSIALTTRGKAFTLAHWEGAVMQHGETDGSRYRLLTWLNDGQRLVAATDSVGEEAFVLLPQDGQAEPELLSGLDIGRPIDLAVNPQKDQIIFSNHRYEIMFLDLATRQLRLIDRGKSAPISGFDWSPDGEWVAYSVSLSPSVAVLKLWRADTGEIYPLSRPLLRDVAPVFDPQGDYLYFLSYRHFDPVYDNLQFDLSFPRGVRPYLITLRDDLPSPFVAKPRAPGDKNGANSKLENAGSSQGEDEQSEDGPGNKNGRSLVSQVRIDVSGIENRVVAFPVAEGSYGRILGMKGGKVLYSRFPVQGALTHEFFSEVPPAKGRLFVYDLAELKEETLVNQISDFRLSADKKTLIYRARNRLRVLKAGAQPAKDAGSRPGRKSGWIDLNRVKVSVLPGVEWQQMYREAWRLQRDQFWTPDMSQVDWLVVYERYQPLLDRIGCRSEFSDLIWEMQGELGTSHCYEWGGDYRPTPKYEQGHLAADFAYAADSDSWHITHVVMGDSWDAQRDSPLNRPGLGVKVGDFLLAINGQKLSRTLSPMAALVNQAGNEVTLTVADEDGQSARQVTVRALKSEMPARYREWVDRKRQQVHQASGNRIGYVHIPDMGPLGYAEFHRGYLAEADRQGLIIDVRYNGGGHVSSRLLEKLARRPIGRIASRWAEQPFPFPEESIAGPMVALTNEHAGSDGDIFCHSFKMMGLGPLIGKRTWGGVVGIELNQRLIDGTLTTQPEYAFWFYDVGWDVENRGTEPDIEIDNRPQDDIGDMDAQLERAIQEILSMLEANPPERPPLDQRPSRALPKLPVR